MPDGLNKVMLIGNLGAAGRPGSFRRHQCVGGPGVAVLPDVAVRGGTGGRRLR
jgi:hypothetical protein